MAERGPAPERWLVIQVERPEDEELAGILVEELLERAGSGVEERDGSILAWLPVVDEDGGSDSVDGVVDELRVRLRGITGLGSLAVSHGWQPHEEWAETWKRGFVSRRVTERIVVVPAWEETGTFPGDITLVLEPGMAFGTAEHPTTRGSLRLLDPRVRAGDRVADVGAGSGILAIAAALLGAERVLALELDPWSCAAARENVLRNRVADRVEVREEAVGPRFLPAEAPFDGIVANLESGILGPLLPGFRAGIRDGGWLIVSGILEDESLSVERLCFDAGFRRETIDREGGWWTAAFLAEPSGG